MYCVFDTRNPASPHRYKRPKAQIPASISEQPESSETTSQNHRSKMKAWFVLFLLLPLCMGKSFHIVCYHCWRFLLYNCMWWILAENSWGVVNFNNTYIFFFLLSKKRILPIYYKAILIKNCNCIHKNCNHMLLQQGSTVAQLRSMLAWEFACSPRVGVGFLRVLRFSP